MVCITMNENGSVVMLYVVPLGLLSGTYILFAVQYTTVSCATKAVGIFGQYQL